jgi:hypothetical protein
MGRGVMNQLISFGIFGSMHQFLSFGTFGQHASVSILLWPIGILTLTYPDKMSATHITTPYVTKPTTLRKNPLYIAKEPPMLQKTPYIAKYCNLNMRYCHVTFRDVGH